MFELLQPLVDVDLFLHLALLLGDARQALVVLAALRLRRGELAMRRRTALPELQMSAPPSARNASAARDRRGEAAQLVARERHGSLRPRYGEPRRFVRLGRCAHIARERAFGGHVEGQLRTHELVAFAGDSAFAKFLPGP